MNFNERKRFFKNHLARLVLLLLAIVAVLPFIFIIAFVVDKGFAALSWSFFTALPSGPGGTGGGVANGILGSLTMIILAGLMGIPWGMAAGIYLSEYGRGKTAAILSFVIDLLTSVPSIIIGIFVYGLIVIRYGFSAYAGGLALAIVMLPIVARSTEEILRLVPTHIREAGLALGIPRWKVVLRIILPGHRAALVTGVMLAVARIFGETAPLLFTALGNQYFSSSLSQPTASLPVQIYNLARSGFPDLEQQAWAGALVLVTLVLFINVITRWFFRPRTAS